MRILFLYKSVWYLKTIIIHTQITGMNFYILFGIMLFFKLSSEVLHKKCISNGKSYDIGQKYNKDENECRICSCEKGHEEKCQNFDSCHKLDCKNNHSYEKNCCTKLKCSGILNFIRTASN